MSDNPVEEAPIPVSVPQRVRSIGLSIAFGVFAVAFLTVGVVLGFIPIFLAIGAAFGGFAYLCHAKAPLKEPLLVAVMTGSVILAGVAGIAVDQDLVGPKYRYFSQSDKQLRVDERAGRTDQLISGGGWIPIAYDKQPIDLGPDAIGKLTLSDANWGAGLPPSIFGKMCFSVSNSSHWVIGKMDITVKTKSGIPVSNATSSDGSPLWDAPITIHPDGVALLGPGVEVRLCGLPSRNLEPGETWTYSVRAVYGWRP